MRILLAQCELQHPQQPPHLAMALYAPDLRADGHEVETALVPPGAITALEERLRGGRHDLVALDSIFPFDLTERIRAAAPGAVLLVGGHNAAQHVLRGHADLAVVGNGRQALRRIAREPAGALRIPGVLARLPGGRIDAGPVPDRPASPFDDLFPFRPDLEWEHLGQGREPDAHRNAPSIVAEAGCPYDPPLSRAPAWEGVEPRLPEADLSPAARDLLSALLVSRARGCAFCAFRYQPFRRRPVPEAVDALMEQARWMARQVGARSLSLQSEHPFPYLVPLLDALERDGIRLEELRIRATPWGVLREEASLRASIARAASLGTRLVLHQIGLEAFADADLALFHKGISAAENRRCARLLAALEAEHGPGVFTGTRGHGLILFHPWTTPESLAENVAAIAEDAPFLLPRLSPDLRLEFYGEWIPVFWKAQDDGLLVPIRGGFGWDFRFRDLEVAAFDRALRALGARLEALTAPPDGAPPALARAWRERRRAVLAVERPRIFRELLAALLERRNDPQGRDRAFRAVADALDRRFS